jgi:prepilin-type N-terminal cleavage/methylation domain-containing protein
VIKTTITRKNKSIIMVIHKLQTRAYLTAKRQRQQAGFSLIEISIAITVMLALAGVAFMGVTAYLNISNRAQCVLNISNVQTAIRTYSNANQDAPGATVTGLQAAVIGAGLMVETPVCPGGGTYTYAGNTVPAVGTAYLTCSLSTTQNHVPKSTNGW